MRLKKSLNTLRLRRYYSLVNLLTLAFGIIILLLGLLNPDISDKVSSVLINTGCGMLVVAFAFFIGKIFYTNTQDAENFSEDIYISLTKLENILSSNIEYKDDMIAVYDEIRGFEPSLLRVFSYIGNFTVRYFSNRKENSECELRLLIRDPRSENSESRWKYPPNSERQEYRKKEVRINIDKLGQGVSFAYFKHQHSEVPESDWVRFFDFEPPLRFVIAEKETDLGKSRMGYIGFYPVQIKNENMDYSGTGRPVIRISDVGMGAEIIDDLINWFDDYWKNISIGRPLLCSIDFKDYEDLNNNTISSDLVQLIRNCGCPLSDKVNSIVLKRDKQWFLHDNEQTYNILREDDKLNVYGDPFLKNGEYLSNESKK